MEDRQDESQILCSTSDFLPSCKSYLSESTEDNTRIVYGNPHHALSVFRGKTGVKSEKVVSLETFLKHLRKNRDLPVDIIIDFHFFLSHASTKEKEVVDAINT